MLPSPFLSRTRSDTIAESWTYSDAVIGHLSIGNAGKANCSIRTDAKQFVVCEAKVFSKLSRSVTNAPYYDQAARSVACIAEVLRRGSVLPADLDNLAFVVLAPAEVLFADAFSRAMHRNTIEEKVRLWVSEYACATQDVWLEEHFLPLLERISIAPLAWEDVIESMCLHDDQSGQSIKAFYGQVLRFNRPFRTGVKA
jgi:hypothetical protein